MPDLARLNDGLVGAAVLAYFDAGFPVFPCKPGSKHPATGAGGYKKARTAAELAVPVEVVASTIEDEDCNIGLPTGVLFDVLDVDVKNGKPGKQAAKKLQAAGLLEGCVATATTPSGGLHFYFPASGSRSGSIGELGLDFQAAGKYVLAAPSKALDVYDGVLEERSYRWTWSRPLADGAPLDWAACRRELGQTENERTSDWVSGNREDDMEHLVGFLLRTTSNRNDALNWACFRAIESGSARSLDDLEPLIKASLAVPPFENGRERELWNTAESAWRAQQ